MVNLSRDFERGKRLHFDTFFTYISGCKEIPTILVHHLLHHQYHNEHIKSTRHDNEAQPPSIHLCLHEYHCC